ncbi:hypothetical protein F8271_10375 [Micromonospora sp. ALFpr18c]|uniref:hypothetical protein n=1 Tax=Micromonospora sp. ALFpr18c TaxID=1458665 RepID=UPI00124B5365|nr:hypothetical protein [Micromonospora sp. ALFpr18c]KAB1943166.1 hypothetical protein F8271_10375 [Micromonospora sp. ALFpr18c]
MTGDRPGSGGWGAQILALGAEVHQLREQFADLTGIGEQVTTLGEDMVSLQEVVQQLLAEQSDKPVRVWDWSAMNKEQAAAAWHTLIDWVRDILAGTYGLVGPTGGRRDKIPACWYRHPDVVTELSWLCQEWHRLYRSAKGTPAGAGEWHDRWLPGTINRLRSDSTMAACLNDDRHVEPRPTNSIDDNSALVAVIEADMAARPDAPAPGANKP